MAAPYILTVPTLCLTGKLPSVCNDSVNPAAGRLLSPGPGATLYLLCGAVPKEERSMVKFSVKKPLTVFVAVLAVLVLGVVA